jgi:hypothetical protein
LWRFGGNHVALACPSADDYGVDAESPSPAQRLYGAAVRWLPEMSAVGHAELIEAAVQCLVEGLDSPSLRMLAGASPSEGADEIRRLLDDALKELDIPEPGIVEPWKQVVAGGGTYSRLPKDIVRFEIVPAAESVGGHEVLVYVNDVEMTSIGAGMGMDPFVILIPTNRLLATPEPHSVPIARCECGTYGCRSTDARVVRDGEVVHWEWELEAPIGHGVTFHAEQYDAEVRRIGADHSWERPEDTIARLVLKAVDDEALANLGLRVSWAAKDHQDERLFKVALWTGSDEPYGSGYQVFLRVSWVGRDPDEVADEVARILRKPPKRWPVTFHSTRPNVSEPPPMAGRRWRRERIG